MGEYAKRNWLTTDSVSFLIFSIYAVLSATTGNWWLALYLLWVAVASLFYFVPLSTYLKQKAPKHRMAIGISYLVAGILISLREIALRVNASHIAMFLAAIVYAMFTLYRLTRIEPEDTQ